MGTHIHLVLEDEYAAKFNRAQQAFFDAQLNHIKTHGSIWNPVTDALFIPWTKEEDKAWDQMAKLINLLIEMNDGGLDISESDITSDFLVKV